VDRHCDSREWILVTVNETKIAEQSFYVPCSRTILNFLFSYLLGFLDPLEARVEAAASVAMVVCLI
jgi:hypothetical protein